MFKNHLKASLRALSVAFSMITASILPTNNFTSEVISLIFIFIAVKLMYDPFLEYYERRDK